MVGTLRTHLVGAVLAVLLLPLAAACSGNGGESLPSRTGTPSRTLTASVPSVTLPSVTRESDVATEEPTAEPTVEESEAVSRSSAGRQPPPRPRLRSPPRAAAPTPGRCGRSSPSSSSASSSPSGSTAGPGVATSTRSFDLALSEARWLGRDLLPTLLTASRDERRGAWSVSRPRVVALEDRLAELANPGSETVGALNAQHLETAVIGVRDALDNESRSGGLDAAAEALGAVKQAARQLDQVLADLLPAAARPG